MTAEKTETTCPRKKNQQLIHERCSLHSYGVSVSETKRPNIAIDGPAGAGKTTIAQLVGHRLGYTHIDSGGMYRAVALMALEEDLDIPSDTQALCQLSEVLPIEYRRIPGKGMRIFLEGEDRTLDLRRPEVEAVVSIVASVAGVRRALVAKQRELAVDGGVVMDGRDIGTHVLPDAGVKVFLTAALPVRIERRLRQKWSNGAMPTWEEAAQTVENRDRIDSTRKESPLKPAHDAVIIDSTRLEREDVIRQISFMVDSLIHCRRRENR